MAQKEQRYWIGGQWVPASQVPAAMRDAYNAGMTGAQVKRDPNTGEPIRSENGEYEFEAIPMSNLQGGQGTDTLAGGTKSSAPPQRAFTMNDVDAARQFIFSRTISYRTGNTSPEARAAAFNVNPIAAVRSANMIAAGEAATGAAAVVTEAWRSDATQAVYYANQYGPTKYKGVTYRPDTYETTNKKGETVTVRRPGPGAVARPGGSNHREGGGLDFSSHGDAGKVRSWMRANAPQFGMRTLGGNFDPPHIEVNERTPLTAEETDFVVRELGYADVQDFQRKNGLGVDGVVGPQTTKAMLAAVSAPSVEAAANPASKPFTVYSSDINKAEKEGKLAAVPPMSVAEARQHVYSGDPFGVASSKGASPAETQAPQGDPTVANLQTYLAQNGFYDGPVNGVDDEQFRTALNNYNAAADPEGFASAQAALAESGVTNPSPQQVADAFREVTTARQTAMAMGPQTAEAPTPQDVTALALDGMDAEVPAQQAAAEMANGTGVETLAGGISPPTPRPRDQAVLNQNIADQLDEAIFGAGPHRGEARARPDTFEWRGGGAPDAGEVPDPSISPMRPAVGGPNDRRPQPPTPPSRASGIASMIRPRPDINDPSLSFNAPEYQGGGPTSGPAPEALADQLDAMVAGREEFPGALPAASRIGDVSAAMGNAPSQEPARMPMASREVWNEMGLGSRGNAETQLSIDRSGQPLPVSDTMGNAPPPASPPITEADADMWLDATRMGHERLYNEREMGGPFSQQSSPPPAPFYGPTGNVGEQSGPWFEDADEDENPSRLGDLSAAMGGQHRRTTTDRVLSILNPPDTTGIDLYRPNTRQSLTADLLDDEPYESVRTADGAIAVPPAWRSTPRTVTEILQAPRETAASPEPNLAFDPPSDQAYEWFHGNSRGYTGEGGAFGEVPRSAVNVVGGPRDQAADIGAYNSGLFSTAPENEIIGRGQGWWETTPEPEYASIIPQGDSDWSPSNANAATMESPVAQNVMADALDAADGGGQPLIGSYGAMGTTPPRIDINTYHPDAMVLNAPGAEIAGRPTGTGGGLVPITQAAAPASMGAGGGAPIIVQAPQLGGGRLNGNSGGLFGLGANWAGPQWTGDVTTGTGPGGQWWSGDTNAMGGSEGLSWQGSDGRTITAYSNDGGRTYTHGYGPQV